jgi:type II secretory pathway component PulF
MNMTTSNLAINLESRWATYAKAAGFLGPAVSLWAISNSFLFPKAKQICDDARLAIPAPLRVVMPMMDLLHEHGLFMFGASLIILLFLEWRSRTWPRYRRPSIGVGVFVVNAVVLVLITAMFTLVLLAAPALFRPR